MVKAHEQRQENGPPDPQLLKVSDNSLSFIGKEEIYSNYNNWKNPDVKNSRRNAQIQGNNHILNVIKIMTEKLKSDAFL